MKRIELNRVRNEPPARGEVLKERLALVAGKLVRSEEKERERKEERQGER